MSKARLYPLANKTAQWWEGDYARATMTVLEKVLLHSTETAGWPGYDAGAKAPNLTYNPWTTGARWRQHNYLNTSARALQDPTSTPVRENRDGVVQVEIVAYCNPASYKKYGHGVNALPDHAYTDLGAFLAFMNAEWGVPLVRAPQWSTYPPPDSIRMSSATYDKFKGVLGHQHASGNNHGDPGLTNAQVDRILAAAKRITSDATGDDMPLTAADITAIRAAVQAELEEFRPKARADMQAENEEYGTRFWVARTGTGTGVRNDISDIKNTVHRIEGDTDDGTPAGA